MEDKSKKWQWLFTISNTVMVLVIIYTAMFLFVGASQAGAIMGSTVVWFIILAGFIFYFIGRVYLRWSKSAEVEAKKWLAFKKYITDFGHFKDALPQALTILEEILLYGTALGVAKKVA